MTKKIITILLFITIIFYFNTCFGNLEENNVINQNVLLDKEEIESNNVEENIVKNEINKEIENKEVKEKLEQREIIEEKQEINKQANSHPTLYSAGGVDTINSNTTLGSKYSWSFKFIPGVTTTETYGMTNFEVDNKMTSIDNKTNKYSARLTSNKQKGKIWCRYNNVGTYNGKIIDLKITLTDWNYLQPANLLASSEMGGVNYPTIFFAKDQIEVNITTYPAVDSPTYLYEFFEHGTNTKINVKCHETFQDMDNRRNFNTNKWICKNI